MITASAQTLFDQSMSTAHKYLIDAVHKIDGVFCDGYAAEHPALVIAYMKIAAYDFRTAIEAKSNQSNVF